MTIARAHRSIPIAELRSSIGEEIARAVYAGERTVITKHGTPAAALISVDDLDLLERLEELDDIRAYDEAKANDDGARFTLADVRSELDKPAQSS